MFYMLQTKWLAKVDLGTEQKESNQCGKRDAWWPILNAVFSKVTFSPEGHKFLGQRHWFEWNFNDELGRAAQWYCNLISFHTCRSFILNVLLLKSRVKFYWDQLNIWSVAGVGNHKVPNLVVQICEPLLAWSHLNLMTGCKILQKYGF